MQVIARLDQKMQAVPGIRLFMQPAQDVSVGGRLSRTLYQYTLQDPTPDELNNWAPKILAADAGAAACCAMSRRTRRSPAPPQR